MIKSIGKMILGGGVAQSIQFVALPFLALIYSPEELGRYFSITAAAAIVTVVGTMQLHHSIPNKQKDHEIYEILLSILMIVVILIVLSLVTAAVFFKEHSLFVFWVVMFSVATAFSSVGRSVLVRGGQFGDINLMMLIRAVSVVVAQFSLYGLFGSFALFYGFMIGEILSSAFVFVKYKSHLPECFPKSGFIQKTLKENKDFLLNGTIQELISVSVLSLPLVFITQLFGIVMAGQFGMAQRIILPPGAIILGAIVSVVHYSYGRKARFEISTSPLFDMKYIMVILAILLPLAWWGSGYAVGLILSKDWEIAAHISQYVALWAVFLVVSAPFRASCRLYAMQATQLSIDLVALVVLIIVYYISTYIDPVFEFIAITFCLIGVFQNAAVIMAVKIKVTRGARALARDVVI